MAEIIRVLRVLEYVGEREVIEGIYLRGLRLSQEYQEESFT